MTGSCSILVKTCIDDILSRVQLPSSFWLWNSNKHKVAAKNMQQTLFITFRSVGLWAEMNVLIHEFSPVHELGFFQKVSKNCVNTPVYWKIGTSIGILSAPSPVAENMHPPLTARSVAFPPVSLIIGVTPISPDSKYILKAKFCFVFCIVDQLFLTISDNLSLNICVSMSIHEAGVASLLNRHIKYHSWDYLQKPFSLCPGPYRWVKWAAATRQRDPSLMASNCRMLSFAMFSRCSLRHIFGARRGPSYSHCIDI